ncbi:MAG: 16S rRNA (uracil(1498)-N(3))-methyltransferase [Verrucomicrobia bacterium]|nr:16S rRNA (uracil(1498)-N(3))-methyltransferase [Verrucomicrobiota bacterium]
MRRFFLPPEECTGKELHLLDQEAIHAARVLRVEPGEEVSVHDGAGSIIHCRVGSVRKPQVTLQALARTTTPREPFRLTLLTAIPKGGIFEEMIPPVVELGVTDLQPLHTTLGNVRLDAETAKAKLGKWNHIAVEAMKQCGIRWLPTLHAPVTLPQALSTRPAGELALGGSLDPDAPKPRQAFASACTGMGTPPNTASIWIGPEGGFTDEEKQLMQRMGIQMTSFGGNILRCATAAIAGIALILQELRIAHPSPPPRS